MGRYDVVVVGSGSIGMAIAFKAAQAMPKAKIAVLYSEDYSAASPAAGMMLGCFGEVTKYTFSNPASVAKFEMMYAAHKEWKNWLAEIEKAAGEKVPHVPGSHIILNTQGGILDEHNYQAVIDALDKHKEPYDTIDPRSIEGLEPAGLAKPLKAIYLPNEGSIDSQKYLPILRKACESRGVEFVQKDVKDISRDDNGYMIDDISADQLVLAAGSATYGLLQESNLGVSIMPIFAGVGIAMTTTRVLGTPFKHTIRTSNRAGSCGLHLVPLGDGQEYLGATNVIAGEAESRASLGMSHFLSQCAIDQLSRKLYFSYIDTWRVGNRPVSLDTMPLIGETNSKRLFVATGTYRDGFHCSPVIAQSLANEMTGGERLVSDMFAVERSPIELMTREQSIEEFCLQEVSSAYETWLHLPNYLEEDMIANEARKAAEEVYEKLGGDLVLHPDLLIYLTMPESAAEAMKNIKAFLKTSK